MALAMEFIDIFVQRRAIEERYEGGWAKCLSDLGDLVGGRVWYDDYLLRDGAMSPQDVQAAVSWWKNAGLEPFKEVDGKPVEWQDLCVSESMFGGTTLPCEWIDYDWTNKTAYLRGSEPGCIVGGTNLD